VLTQVRPRAVLHLAVQRATFSQPPAGDGDALTIGPLEVLLAGLSEIPGARLVHTSTSWVLEPGVSLDEGAQLRPQSAYAEHKALADRRLPGLAQPAGVEWIDLRLFNVFGRYEQASRLLPYLVARLSAGEEARVSRGDQLRDFNDVDHVAEAYLRALAAPPAAAGRVYHIGSGRGTTARELAMAVAEETGRADLIRFGARDTPDAHVACLVANPARARELLGWEPHTDLEARIARAVRWWQERSQRGR
jgi:polyisoprenyl-phosphate glycosyltransferase